MAQKIAAVTVLLLLPLMALAQTTEQDIKSETELAAALCHFQKDERSRDVLLRTHPQLVNSRLWEDAIRRAVAAYYQESPERALKIYEVSIQVATKLRDPKLLARTYYNLARTLSGVNQLEKAIESYERSREYFEQAGLRRDVIYVLADLGAIYFNKENYQRAKEYSEQSILIADSVKSSDVPVGSWPDDFGRARALNTLAEMDLRNSNHEDAIEKLQRSLSLYQELNGQGSNYNFYIAGVYAALGKVYPETGEYSRALLYLNKALDIERVSGDQDSIALVFNSIGYLYMEQEDYAQAKEHFDRSLKIYTAEKNQIEASKVLLNLGVIEQRQAHYDEALTQFRLSLQAAKATQITDVQIAAGEGIGVVLTAKRNLGEALAILNESLTTAKKTGNKTREIELTWRSAQTLYEMENYGEAAALGEVAVSLARSAHLPKLEYLATTTLGQVYAAQGKLESAKQTLIRATQQLETLREQVAGRETASQLYFENKLTSYHALVDILAQQEKPIEALLYAERAKARVLLDVVSGNRTDFSKSLTQAEKEQQLRLNRKISDLNERVKASGGTAGDPLYSQLDSARLEYQAFQDSIYITHPDLRRRSGRTTELRAAELSELTATDTAYLEYVVTRGKVWLFVLTKDWSTGVAEVRSYQLGIEPLDLLKKVNLFHDRLANRHPDYASLALELYRSLISPAETQLRQRMLCVIPDSFLWNLPFQALMKTDGHFLIEDHPLYYAASLSVLHEMRKKGFTNKRTRSSLIAFGNPVIGKDAQRNEELCPLPEAETEVKSIASSFSPTGRKVLIGRAATEKTFKALAPTYTTIHLATHGVLDNGQPLYSHLLLTKTDTDTDNDGLLEAREIMNMSLHADLAVLSACETANGKIAPGEGVIGMSWSFFVAGTGSVLVSQWKINSASTSELMVNFYSIGSNQRLLNNRDVLSLRESALRLMKNARFHHPFYWAGFVLVKSV